MFNPAQTRDDVRKAGYVSHPEVVGEEEPRIRDLIRIHHAGTTSTSRTELQLPEYKKSRR